MVYQLVEFLCLTAILLLGCAAQDRTNATRDLGFSDDDSRLCFVKTLNQDGRVIAVTSLGEIPHDDAARFDTGIIWRRPSRMGRVGLSGEGHGRGSATLLATLCKLCRKHNKERCLRRFCNVRMYRDRVTYSVKCL